MGLDTPLRFLPGPERALFPSCAILSLARIFQGGLPALNSSQESPFSIRADWQSRIYALGQPSA